MAVAERSRSFTAVTARVRNFIFSIDVFLHFSDPKICFFLLILFLFFDPAAVVDVSSWFISNV